MFAEHTNYINIIYSYYQIITYYNTSCAYKNTAFNAEIHPIQQNCRNIWIVKILYYLCTR